MLRTVREGWNWRNSHWYPDFCLPQSAKCGRVPLLCVGCLCRNPLQAASLKGIRWLCGHHVDQQCMCIVVPDAPEARQGLKSTFTEVSIL